jgi:hypothetical protein
MTELAPPPRDQSTYPGYSLGAAAEAIGVPGVPTRGRERRGRSTPAATAATTSVGQAAASNPWRVGSGRTPR